MYFMGVAIRIAIGPEEALQMIEDHFEDDCTKHVNDNVRLELNFDLTKLS